MKRAVSISLGSSRRDAAVEIDVLGVPVRLERIGTDGDIERATQLFTEFDGQVDALGVGGIDLWVETDQRRYSIRAAHKLIQGVSQTAVVDGSGLKTTLERQVVPALIDQVGEQYASGRVLLTAGIDRFGMSLSFVEHGYETIFGDLMFVLGVPLPIRSFANFKRLAAVLAPLATQLPISMLYPTGSHQEKVVPKYGRYYAWATVIAGDCHYIKRHMPDDLSGKLIVTNTTTTADLQAFAERGVRQVMTTTPILNGRSFGTNMLEAALTAAAGKQRPLTHAELTEMIARMKLTPTVHWL